MKDDGCMYSDQIAARIAELECFEWSRTEAEERELDSLRHCLRCMFVRHAPVCSPDCRYH